MCADSSPWCSVVQLFSLHVSPGLLWPLQSLPGWLRIISYIFPVAMPAEGARAIMLRGKNVVSFISSQH